MKNSLIVFIFFTSIVSFSQNVLMGEEGFLENNPAPCSTFGTSGENFFDDGDGVANYSSDFNDTTVFCPDLSEGSKMTLFFDVIPPFVFDVDGSDSLYIYDGPNTTAPLMATINTATNPLGVTLTASFTNLTGCITVVFISDGAIQGEGWAALVSCGDVGQPYEPHVEAYINGSGGNVMAPLDTGFVDICFGDSILLVATPVFPLSFENTGLGYSQTVSNVDYTWNISDGGVYANNDSVWFKPPNRLGYIVDLLITDQMLVSEQLVSKVRVSQLPNFSEVGPVNDSICLGEVTSLVGGVTAADTAGIDVPAGTFQLGGSFAGTTFLPDGAGNNFEAPVTITGFPNGSVVNNSQDLNQVCITMEHTFLGDLEIALRCPNGTEVTLINSYSPGFIPGGVSGGTINLGDPDLNDGTGPGTGMSYCFSSVYNTWGDYPTELAANNVIPTPSATTEETLNPNGVYLPEEDFIAFAGCPVNGDWTIVVQDNLGIDDGYIFEWGLFFDGSFFGLSGYQNTVVSSEWADDPTIVSGQNDTALVVMPNVTGFTDYTFIIEDDFGCIYDTTVALFVMPLPTIFSDTLVCSYELPVLNTTSFSGGVWSSADPEIQFNNPTSDNPLIFTDTLPGTYSVTYTDNECNTSITSIIDFPEYPGTWLVDTAMCEGSVYIFEAINDNVHETNYSWNNGITGEQITFSEPGTYVLTMNNVCYEATDSLIFEFKRCDIEAPNVISLAQGSQNPLWYLDAEGLSEITIVITNRWGNVVYECSDSVELCKWDGTNRKGDSVDEGVYFYRVDAITDAQTEIQKHGFINVVR